MSTASSRKKRSDGEGTIYQAHIVGCPRPLDARGNTTCKCKYRGALVTGYRTTTAGNIVAVRRTVTATSRSGAASRLRELREKVEAQTLPAGKAPTLEQWLNHVHARMLTKLRESSRVTYRGVFDNYLIPLLGHQRLDRLTADDIEDAWLTLAEVGNPLLGEAARPLSPTTIHHAHTILVRMLRLAIQRKKIATNPAGPDSMDAPPKTAAEVEPLSTADWKKVLATAPQVPNPARWTVALALGLRQGESVGLRWEDVDLDAGVIRIRQTLYRLPGKGLVFGPPKTERSKREMVLPTNLVAELKVHRKEQTEKRLHAGDQWHDHGLVFTLDDGRPLDPSSDRRRWKALLEKAGVEPIKLHAARHTAATILLLRGVDPRVVMDIMGWSQISTAANYQHAVSEAKRDAAAAMGTALWGTQGAQ